MSLCHSDLGSRSPTNCLPRPPFRSRRPCCSRTSSSDLRVAGQERQVAERLVDVVGLACPDTLQRVDEALAGQAAAIAADHDLTVYDAAYVAAARKHDWTLVSADID